MSIHVPVEEPLEPEADLDGFAEAPAQRPENSFCEGFP